MSKIIVLDTHIWLWLINSDFDKFPSYWIEEFEYSEKLAVSPLSCYEIALAYQRGRIELNEPIQEWIQKALTFAKIDLLPITPQIALRAVNLSPIHKDPFDRIIIATALEYGAKLASIDNLFTKYEELKDYLMSENNH
jgi:PIN domain nuclease of toxin-antitoxin system